MLCMVAAFILSNASQILQQWVVAAWTSDVGYVKRPLGVYLASISFMATCVGAFTYLRTYLQVYIGAAASRTIHRKMIAQILGAPLSFFGMIKTVEHNYMTLSYYYHHHYLTSMIT